MKYAAIVAAFLLGLVLAPSQGVKAQGIGLVRVTEVTPGGVVSVGNNVVGFSCAPGKENMHCYVASAQ